MAITYFLKIEGIDGGSRDADHKGWFEINGYDWELTQTGTTHAGTGGGEGKAQFSDLLIDLNLDGLGLAPLLRDAATGTHIESVELQGVKGGENPFTFYDLKLSDVLVTDVVDRAGSHDTLALDFSKVALTTTEHNDTGGADVKQTFAFDVGGVVAALAAAPAVAETVTVAAAAIDQVPTGQTFFLKIGGIDGGSRDADHKGWFEINGYDWELTQTGTTHAGTGGGEGKAQFSDLLIDLNLDGLGLAPLLRDAATGTHIESVELQGVKGGENPFTFYDLKLSDVLVTDVVDRAGSHDTLALDFSKVALTTTEHNDTGGADVKQTFAFDVGGVVAALAAAPAVAETVTVAAAAIDQVPTGQTFFLKIEGIDGGSRDADHKGWFEINGYDWELTQTGTTHAGTGGGEGKAQFSDLLIDLNLDGLGLAPLLRDAATGTHIESVELQGVKGGENPFTFYDLKLSDVLVTDVVDRAGSHDTLALDFSKVALTTTEHNDTGGADVKQTFAFDVGGVVAALAAAPAVAETVTVAAAAIDQVPTGQTFFLKIGGIDGGSRDADHKGWFEINGYDWELTQTGTTHAGTGGGEGKAQFSDLLIDLNLDGLGLAPLLRDAATGTHIESVELQGVKGGENPFTFYDLKLSDVLVTDVVDRAGSHDTLALDFSKVALTTTEHNDTGGADVKQTFAFDVGGVVAALAAAPAVAETVTVAAAAIDQVPTGQTFFLKIEGIDGGSRDADHKGWFEINGYDWELTQTGTTHAGTGGGEGKAQFSDLLIDLNLDGLGLAPLLRDAATGTHIESVELQGVKGGENPFTFYDLKLSDVLVTDVVDRAGSHDTLALDFSKVALTTTEHNDTGGADVKQTFAFDVGGVVAALAAAPAVAETVTVAAAAIDQVPTGQTFFLKIEGIDGGSRDADHKGWFEINGYDWELTQTGTTHAGTGGGEGKAQFSDLLIDLNLDGLGLAPLLRDAATGTHIESVELQGVKGGENLFTFYDLKLSDVLVTDVVDRAGSHDTLALDFSKVTLTTTEHNDTGGADAKVRFAFDILADKVLSNNAPIITTPPVVADVVRAIDGSYHAGGVIEFLDPDADLATATIALDTIKIVGTDVPAFKYDVLRPGLESAIKIDALTGAWSFDAAFDPAQALAANETLVATYVGTVDDNVSDAVVGAAPASLFTSVSLAAATPVGLTATQTITLTFTGVNDAPVVDVIATRPLNETPHQTGSTVPLADTVNLHFIDPDLSETGHTAKVTLAKASGDTTGLTLDAIALAGLLTAGPVIKLAGEADGTAQFVFSALDKTFDYLGVDQKLLLSYGVEIDDSKLAAGTQTISFEITGSNDAPVITSAANIVVAENNMAVGTITAVDPEHDAFLFGPGSGSDQTFFSIDPHTGALSFLNSPDFETPEDANRDNVYDLAVSVTDVSGASSTQTIHVSVTDVVEVGQTIRGGNGNDIITGTAGNDTIDGGNGTDHINGGDGKDKLSGGNGDDTLIGGRGDDVLDGGNGDDRLDGGVGNNQLSGGNGNDILNVGDGNNVLDGGNGDDILIAGNGNNVFFGGNGNDTLTAGNGSNNFTGGNGDDTFHVGTGNNTLTGGNGNDKFVFGPTFGKDVIADFSRGDHIEFDGGVFANFQAVQAVMHQAGTDTVISLGADHSITLQHVSASSLHASDFLLS